MGRVVPRFCEREAAAFLCCGILAHGFARVRRRKFGLAGLARRPSRRLTTVVPTAPTHPTAATTKYAAAMDPIGRLFVAATTLLGALPAQFVFESQRLQHFPADGLQALKSSFADFDGDGDADVV